MQILVTDEIVNYKTWIGNHEIKLYIRRGIFKDVIIYERMVIAKRYFGFFWTRKPNEEYLLSYTDRDLITKLLD